MDANQKEQAIRDYAVAEKLPIKITPNFRQKAGQYLISVATDCERGRILYSSAGTLQMRFDKTAEELFEELKGIVGVYCANNKHYLNGKCIAPLADSEQAA